VTYSITSLTTDCLTCNSRLTGLETVFQNCIASLRYKIEIASHSPNIASQFNFHTMCTCAVVFHVCRFTGLHYTGVAFHVVYRQMLKVGLHWCKKENSPSVASVILHRNQLRCKILIASQRTCIVSQIAMRYGLFQALPLNVAHVDNTAMPASTLFAKPDEVFVHNNDVLSESGEVRQGPVAPTLVNLTVC
jgi:hypothetical protein